MSDPIVVVEYDPGWPAEFARLRDRAQAALGEVAVAIEHVGSTAVPGLATKPVIDMVVVASEAEVAAAIGCLERIGYAPRGDLGVEGREAFDVPAGEPLHHLYVSPATSAELQAQLRFRDRLLADPALAAEYAALKRALAIRFRDDRPAYTDAKTDFVTAVVNH